jgi:hypothetical protein
MSNELKKTVTVCLLGSPPISFQIVPASPKMQELKRKLSLMPPAKLTAEQARTQVKIHLREARQELLKHGHELQER